MKAVSKAERSAAFEKVFGGVNGKATKRVSLENARKGEVYQAMRVGKTKRDKANGHNPNSKNVREWVSFSGKAARGAGVTGEWVKR